ncbi:fasciclin domain-containing protein [Hamadaea tsunoensis]|uniref:fasciclin domain-containing protein n=1 Tax=Hamadaea tsunoensis TaxID=53368 RepID=UPI0003F9E1CB|nr:fasciclin domain-containing protein [Hamadaea tsunoensis]
MNTKRKFAAVLATGAAAVALAACSSNAATEATGSSAAPAMSASASSSMSEPFGPACSSVPTDASNPGSFDAMAKVPVATAASGNPALSTLVTAVGKANLGDTLNSAPELTVFAPTNDAFAKIPKADLDKVLADQATLKKILTYHVVAGKITPDQLAGTHKTLEGQNLTVTGSGENFKVNGTATVVCGNVQTQNAIVYIVDGVLMPS